VVENLVIIKPKVALTTVLQSVDSLPTTDIHGKITDSLGTPIQGVSVSIKGTDLGAITDKNGEFVLKNVASNTILIISHVGFEKQEIKIGEKKAIAIRLKPSSLIMSNVTVEYSTGYENIPQERATGSFAFVDNKLFNQNVSSDVVSRLEGNVPGLLFNHNTVASENGYDINIRGHSTLFSNDQPLIVLDNFAYDGSLGNLNPNDIESITVLKDAAAASIWGVRAGNGVIVITTKTAKRNQKISAEVNANVTVGSKPNLFYNPNFLDANDYINIESNLFDSGYYSSTLSQPYNLVTPVVQILAEEQAGTISSSNGTSQINALRSQDVRDDLTKYFYQKPINQQYAVNLRGGGINNDYYLSFGYDNNLANQVGNVNNRMTINSSYNLYPIRNLQITLGINYTQTSSKNDGTSGNLSSYYPYMQLADSKGNPLPISTDYSPHYKDSMTNNYGLLNWEYRPLAEIGLADNTTKGIDNLIKLGIRYALPVGLSVELKYQYEKSSVIAENYNSDSTYYTRNLINEFTQISPSGLIYPIPIGGILDLSNAYLTSQQMRGQLGFSHIWSGKHELTVTGGTEIRQAVNENNTSTAYGYDNTTGNNIPTIDYADNFQLNPPGGSGQIPNNSSFGKTTNNFISYYSDAAYTFNRLYTFSLSGRIDHSNLFGVSENQKAVPLYSAGISWDISNERFYHISWLPFIKTRVTYGYSGNINTSAAAVLTILQYSNASYTNLEYATVANPPNPDLRWEKDRMTNFGLDFGLKNNILSGSMEYYLKNGLNLFGSSPLAPSSGLTTFFGNVGSTSGHGADLLFNSKNIDGRRFKWTTNLMLTHVVDKVTKYNVPSTAAYLLQYGSGNSGTIVPIVGANEFGMYSYKWAGLTHLTGDPQGFIGGKPSTDYSTILSNATIDSLQYDGPSRPTTFGSLRNTLTYDKFSLSFNLIYNLHYYFRRTSISDVASIGLGSAGNRDYLRRWQKPGDELHTNVPYIDYPPFDGNRESFYQYSSALVDKGDNIRVQDISLSYVIDKSIWKTIPFARIQVYGYINNVGMLWRANKDGLDPNAIIGYPAPRTVAIGIKINY
jgi:TonB-linked SusC/RagA family outer membrane protein